jgi:hypothetical protein
MPSAPCLKISRNVKYPLKYGTGTDKQNSAAVSRLFLPASLLSVLAATRAENSGC